MGARVDEGGGKGFGEHVAHGHIPFRKDCLVCQQASSKGKLHRRLGKNVQGGVKNTPLKEDEDPPDEEDGGELPEVEEKKEEIEEIEDEEKKNRPKRGRPRKPRPEDDG